jgi:hypothetical protein
LRNEPYGLCLFWFPPHFVNVFACSYSRSYL